MIACQHQDRSFLEASQSSCCLPWSKNPLVPAGIVFVTNGIN
jgi:hypothetical protein